jgi:hypothetical protein
MTVPIPDPFVSGTLIDGRLALVRESGAIANCDAVLMCLGTLTDNEDSTFDLDFPGGS